MKTATEYRKQFNLTTESEDTVSSRYDDIEAAINEAIKDTIIKCSEIAKSEWVRWGEHMGHQVEKSSILNLINKLQ